MPTAQLAFDLPGFGSDVPDLASYTWIIANISGGKDSAAMLYELFWHARDAGVLDRIVCVHADLGSAEWEGTKELAAEHAACYGLRFEVVARNGRRGPARGYVFGGRRTSSGSRTSRRRKVMTVTLLGEGHDGPPPDGHGGRVFCRWSWGSTRRMVMTARRCLTGSRQHRG